MYRWVVGLAFAAAVMLIGFGSAGLASAAPQECMHRFGSPQRLQDVGGAVVQEWAVTDLKRSADAAPGYPLAGQLWEATASVRAVSGTVTPIIPNVWARTADGGSYPVLWQLASPHGLSGATLSQGQMSTGKVYFDVTGADPVAVVYVRAGEPPLMWCCDGDMMEMPMADCPMCGGQQPCPCCAR